MIARAIKKNLSEQRAPITFGDLVAMAYDLAKTSRRAIPLVAAVVNRRIVRFARYQSARVI